MSLPVTNNQAASPPQQAAPLSAMMVVGGRLKEYASNTFKSRKAWSEVFDRTAISRPANFSEAATRLKKNAAYFKVNYLIIIIAFIAIGFIRNPSSLAVLAAILGGWIYVFVVRQSPLAIGGRTLSEREKLIGMGAVSLVTIFLFSVHTVVLSALFFAAIIIGLHGAARVPDDLFLDDVEVANTGLLSMFQIPNPVSTPIAVA